MFYELLEKVSAGTKLVTAQTAKAVFRCHAFFYAFATVELIEYMQGERVHVMSEDAVLDMRCSEKARVLAAYPKNVRCECKHIQIVGGSLFSMTLTVFRRLFGDGATVRVLDFFLDNAYFEYSQADVLREESISYNTVRPVWDDLVRSGVIPQTRKLGEAQMYKLNKPGAIVQRLRALEAALVSLDETDTLVGSARRKTRRVERTVA